MRWQTVFDAMRDVDIAMVSVELNRSRLALSLDLTSFHVKFFLDFHSILFVTVSHFSYSCRSKDRCFNKKKRWRIIMKNRWFIPSLTYSDFPTVKVLQKKPFNLNLLNRVLYHRIETIIKIIQFSFLKLYTCTVRKQSKDTYNRDVVIGEELFMHNSLWQKQIYHEMQILTVNFLLL
jgi:hypothetical protein